MISTEKTTSNTAKISNWSKYFTPLTISHNLVEQISESTPEHVVDICAGTGNLLSAAHKRWPDARLEGNDLYKESGDQFDVWSQEDGRNFALKRHKIGKVYDLVIANPPFGKCVSNSQYATTYQIGREATHLINSSKMECAMTVASALLVGKNGILATIIPETIVLGETYLPLRQWLGRRFKKFEIQQLARGSFDREDLGLTFLTAYKRNIKQGYTAKQFIKNTPKVKTKLEGIDIFRGCMISSQTTSRGRTKVVHCGGKSSVHGYVIRRCYNSISRQKNQRWIQPGDIIVSRIGRMAGMASIYKESEPAIITDCIYCLKFSDIDYYKKIRSKILSGEFNIHSKSLARGLGAQYITKQDLYKILSTHLPN